MGFRGTVVKRIIQALITIVIALSIDFVFFHLLPGDPASLLSRNPNIGEVVQQRIIQEFGLDQPLYIQYGLFLVNFLQGNLGVSFHFQTDVQNIIFPRLGNTILLILPATIVSILTGIWIGKKSAWKRDERTDIIGLLVSLVTYSIPSFWLSMFFIMLFAVSFHLFPLTPWIPSANINNPVAFIMDMLSHLILPWLVLWIALIGVFALIMRSALLDVLSEDYMITAKAKGRSEDEQLNKEAVPNAMIPVATIIALNLGASVAGALQVEVVFSYPGIGRLLWDGIIYRDYPLLQATFFMITIVIVFANLIADFLYYVLDPRIRVGREFVITEEKRQGFLQRWFSTPRLLMLSLIVLNLGVFLAYPAYLLISLTISFFLIVILKVRPISLIIVERLKSYLPENLRFLWSNHRSRLLSHFSLLFLTINLMVFSVLALFNIYGSDWTVSWLAAFIGIAGFPPNLGLLGPASSMMVLVSTIAHPTVTQLSLLGTLVGWFLARRKRMAGMVKQFISSPLGIAGTITVAVFVCMAIFGDILAPYNPQQHLTGLPYRRPSPLPDDQSILSLSSIGIFIVGIVAWLFAVVKKKDPAPSFFKRIALGALLLSIGALFGTASVGQNSATGIAGGIGIGAIGLYFIALGYSGGRNNLRCMIRRESLMSVLGVLFIAIGFAMMLLSLIVIVTANPTSYPGFHVLGTDQLGRDVFSQLVIGVRITLVIGLVATTITMGIGTLIGLFAGYYGGLADSILMRLTDVFFVIPGLVIMLILGAILPPSVYTLIFVIGIFSWPSTARIVRGQVLTIKERGYIERVRAVGGSNVYIMGKHVLPAVAPLVVANTVLVTAYAILSEVVLDFFGLGDPSMVSWGTMLYQAFGSGAMSNNLWWLVFPPGILVIFLLLGVSLMGYAMDEIANPRLRRR
jgi:peptide/nickel transport system permease protein